MNTQLTENEFSKHVNTKFNVNAEAPQPIELELVEVKSYENKDKSGEQSGMERFSVYFKGPSNPFLQQATYSLLHERLGEVVLFLVPIAQDENGFRYEAVFNYHLNLDES